jgi:hypothetical protein
LTGICWRSVGERWRCVWRDQRSLSRSESILGTLKSGVLVGLACKTTHGVQGAVASASFGLTTARRNEEHGDNGQRAGSNKGSPRQ